MSCTTHAGEKDVKANSIVEQNGSAVTFKIGSASSVVMKQYLERASWRIETWKALFPTVASLSISASIHLLLSAVIVEYGTFPFTVPPLGSVVADASLCALSML